MVSFGDDTERSGSIAMDGAEFFSPSDTVETIPRPPLAVKS